MPKSRKDIHHLNAGEWSAKVYKRSDHEKHASACRTAKNMISWPHGPITKRKGTEMIAPAKYDDKLCIPIRFRFSKEDTLCMEFGDQYVRFHQNGEQVREAATTISGITSASPAVVTDTGHGYSDGDEIYVYGLTEMVELNGRWLKVANSTTNTYELTDRDGNAIDSSAWTAETTGGSAEKVYEITSPYLETDLYNLDYSQKNDVTWFVDGRNPVQRLIRLGETNWTLEDYPIVFPPTIDPNVESGYLLASSVTAVGASGTLTATGHTPFESDHVGSQWVLRHFRPAVEKNARTSISGGDNISSNVINVLGPVTLETSGKWTGTVTVYKSTVEDPNLTSYSSSEWTSVGAYTSDDGAGGEGKNFNVEFLQEEVSRYYFVVESTTDANATIRSQSTLIEGVVEVTGFTSSTVVDIDVIREVQSTATTEDWSEGAWSAVQGYPSVVCQYEKALWFANTERFPQGIWKSQVDVFDNFKTGADDTDGLFIELDSKERNDIIWMVDQDKLLIGTSGAEWTLSGTDLSEIISPTNILARRQENKGSRDIRPETVDDVIMYVQRGRTPSLRALSYKFEDDRFKADDMQEFSEHLTSGDIKALAYQNAPDPIIWVCTGDGRLLSFTYERAQNVYAWNPHDTNGRFEGVEVIYGQEDDEVWVTVVRVFDGVERRFIERMEGYYAPSVTDAFRDTAGDLQVAFCVDTTAGMATDIDALVAELDAINAVYASTYRDVQYALVGFKDDTDAKTPLLDFTSYEFFKEALEGITPADGGDTPDDAYGAITTAVSGFTWLADYDHRVVLLTNTTSHERTSTKAEALTALQSITAKFDFGYVVNADYQDLADQTEGFDFTSATNFTAELGTAITVPESISKKRLVDCSLYFERNSDLTIRGLWHLEGQTVSVLADGFDLEDQVVTNGAITFEQKNATIFIGLKYTAEVEPLQLLADSNMGESNGYTKNLISVYANLIDTIRLKYNDGSTDATGALKFRDVAFRSGNQDQLLPAPLFNGEVELMMAGGHTRDPRIILRHDFATPFTLAGLTIHYEITGE